MNKKYEPLEIEEFPPEFNPETDCIWETGIKRMKIILKVLYSMREALEDEKAENNIK